MYFNLSATEYTYNMYVSLEKVNEIIQING